MLKNVVTKAAYWLLPEIRIDTVKRNFDSILNTNSNCEYLIIKFNTVNEMLCI